MSGHCGFLPHLDGTIRAVAVGLHTGGFPAKRDVPVDFTDLGRFRVGLIPKRMTASAMTNTALTTRRGDVLLLPNCLRVRAGVQDATARRPARASQCDASIPDRRDRHV